MAKFDVLIKANGPKDSDPLGPKQLKRLTEGDIIDIRRFPSEWSDDERRNALIVVLDNAPRPFFDRLTMPLYVDGRDEEPEIGSRDIASVDLDDEIPIRKRKYCIRLARLKNLFPQIELTRVRDPSDNYQPFKIRGWSIDLTVDRCIYDKHEERMLFLVSP